MALGKQVKKYRLALGLTLEQLADRSGVELGTISALENRDSKKSSSTAVLARALHLSVEELLDEDTDWAAEAAARRDARPVVTPSAQSAREPARPYGATPPPWPLPTVTPTQWNSLGEREQGLVEGFVRGLIEGKGGHRKSRKTGTTD